MGQIITVILGFVLTGLIGNQLVQRWQQRNWVHQQRFLGAEKEYIALRELSDELSKAIAVRLYRMRRLLWSLRRSDTDLIASRLQDYDSTAVAWNESLSSFYVRLAFYVGGGDSISLEHRIHEPFQQAGADLEQLVRLHRSGNSNLGAALTRLELRMNSLQGKSLDFTKDLMRVVERKKRTVYAGTVIHYSRHTIDQFSTWELIKVTFARDVDRFSVRRSSSDLL